MQRFEDELAITRLVASYGPLVDAGEAEAVAGLWADDGSYDVEGWQMTQPGGHPGDGGVRRAPGTDRRRLLALPGPAHVHRATATTPSRCASRSWCGTATAATACGARAPTTSTCGASADGWRIAQRTTRALDGAAEARDLLARGALGNTL